jgi:hypothetical protein
MASLLCARPVQGVNCAGVSNEIDALPAGTFTGLGNFGAERPTPPTKTKSNKYYTQNHQTFAGPAQKSLPPPRRWLSMYCFLFVWLFTALLKSQGAVVQ